MAGLSPNEAYSLLSSTIAPRPIAFVSTLGSNGVANLAPFSFFMVGGANPPSLMFSPSVNGIGGMKDSLRNVIDSGEFVVNTVHREMAHGMNATSAPFPPHESEWEASGFSQVPSVLVRPPRVAESLVQFECRLFQVVEHGDGPAAARYVIGEVVMAHLAEELWDPERRKARPAMLLARMGGAEYLDAATSDRFELQRPV